MSVKHPGFKTVQKQIAKKSGVTMESAGAILANSSRRASREAKEKNPRLNRVRGKSKAESEAEIANR